MKEILWMDILGGGRNGLKCKAYKLTLTFGSALMLAQRPFGVLGFSFVQLNLIHIIITKSIVKEQ